MTGATERLTWVGHATALVEMGGTRLLTDPVLGRRVAHLRRHGAEPAAHVRERIDAVLVSHVHADHLDFPSLRRLPRDARVIVPRGGARLVDKLGFAETIELTAGERVDVGAVTVEAFPADHDGRRWPWARPVECLGYVISGPQRVYFAGDTDVFDGMRDLADGLDVALLPVWGWGPSLGAGHMGPHAAARAAALLRPRVAVPIHWGTLFPRGLHRWRGHFLVEPPQAFARHVAELAPDVRVEVLSPGGTLGLAPAHAGR